MTTHQITSSAGWYQVVEPRADGTVPSIEGLRTDADGRTGRNTYVRTQNGAEVFKVGHPERRTIAPAQTEAPITAPEST